MAATRKLEAEVQNKASSSTMRTIQATPKETVKVSADLLEVSDLVLFHGKIINGNLDEAD